MRWTGHVTRIAEKTNTYGILYRKSEGKRPLGVDGRMWTGFKWLRVGSVAVYFGLGNELSGPIKYRIFLD
jgi:hypothetical protein